MIGVDPASLRAICEFSAEVCWARWDKGGGKVRFWGVCVCVYVCECVVWCVCILECLCVSVLTGRNDLISLLSIEVLSTRHLDS